MTPAKIQRIGAALGLALVVGVTALGVGRAGVGGLGELAASVRGFGASVGRAVFSVAVPGDPLRPAEEGEGGSDGDDAVVEQRFVEMMRRAAGTEGSAPSAAAPLIDIDPAPSPAGRAGGSSGSDERRQVPSIPELFDELLTPPSPKAESAGPTMDGGDGGAGDDGAGDDGGDGPEGAGGGGDEEEAGGGGGDGGIEDLLGVPLSDDGEDEAGPNGGDDGGSRGEADTADAPDAEPDDVVGAIGQLLGES